MYIFCRQHFKVASLKPREAGDPLPCKEIQVRIRITYSMCGLAEDPDLRVAASVCCCRPTHSSGHLRPPSCLCPQCRPPGRSQLCFRPSQVAVNQQTLAAHLTNVRSDPAALWIDAGPLHQTVCLAASELWLSHFKSDDGVARR